METAKQTKQRLIRLIHVAKTQLMMGDDDYRALLANVSCGKTSSTKLSIAELELAIRAMKAKGFVVTTKQNSAAKAKPGKAKSSSSASGHNFGRLIPLVQQAVDAAANPEGWARLGDVVKQLPQLDAAFAPQNHGFDDARDAIRAIYADWLEINKIGRGERVRINKRFVVREERADSRTEVAAAPISNDAATDTPIPEQTP